MYVRPPKPIVALFTPCVGTYFMYVRPPHHASFSDIHKECPYNARTHSVEADAIGADASKRRSNFEILLGWI